MINLQSLKQSSHETEVNPSNNLFNELGRNTYDYKDLLSELIDNSIAARRNDRPLDVIIDIYVDSNNKPAEFLIRDDAKGIPEDKLGLAISPAGLQSSNSLNEHGLGMKQAVAALGNLNYLATKTDGESQARVIREFRFGKIPTFYADFDQDTGTEISIINLRPIVVSNPSAITTSIASYLGARYRRYLRLDNKLVNLKINLRSSEQREGIKSNWLIQEIKPIYFHPSTRKNEPVILKHPIEGSNWKAELTFGYAPTRDEEYIELGLQIPNKFDPYKVSLGKQGLDILYQDRVILFHQLSELGIVPARHNNYNSIRGEIDLKEGFSTAITKNSIISDTNFSECIDKVRRILNGQEAGPDGKAKDYLGQKRYLGDIPENLLRDRLASWLSQNPIQKRKNVKTEYVVEGIEGYIDILADGEAWELKINQASAYDVYQLFMYMDVGEINKAFLVADSFSTGAQVAAEHVATKHKKEIVLAPRDQFPINHLPDDNERTEYLS